MSGPGIVSRSTQAGGIAAMPLATSSRSGSMSAGDKAKLDTLGPGEWFDDFNLRAGVWAPGVTRSGGLDLGAIPKAFGITNAGDGESDGGSVTGQSGAAWAILTRHILQAPKTVPWIIAFDMKPSVPATTMYMQAGLVNDAASQNVSFGHTYDNGAGDPRTKLFRTSYNAGAEPTTPEYLWTIDGARHTIAIAFDGATARWLLNWAVIGSSTDLSKWPTTPCGIGTIATAGSPNPIWRIAWAV